MTANFTETAHPRANDGKFAAKHNAEDNGVTLDVEPSSGAYEPPAGDQDLGGYAYQADLYTPDGLVEQMIREGRMSPGARGMDSERAIEQMGEAEGVDVEDEYTYDTDDFPKPVRAGEFRHGDTAIDQTGRHVKVDRGDDIDLEFDGPMTEIEDVGDAQYVAQGWASGGDGTYQFSSSGTITPDGLHDWGQTLKEVGDPEPDDPEDPAHELKALVGFLHDEAGRQGIARDVDEFAEAGDLGEWYANHEREQEVFDMWDSYAKTSTPVKEWWAGQQA